MTEQVRAGGTNDFRIAWTNGYDALNRLTERTDACTNTTYYVYNATNNYVSREWRYLTRGTPGTNDDATAATTCAWTDNLDRKTNRVHPDGLSEQWEYARSGCGSPGTRIGRAMSRNRATTETNGSN